jgi:hypothetical protein
MHVMGQWNWWSPRWMAAVHRRLGFSDGHARAAARTTTVEVNRSAT